jgi:hypothetical protein
MFWNKLRVEKTKEMVTMINMSEMNAAIYEYRRINNNLNQKGWIEGKHNLRNEFTLPGMARPLNEQNSQK